GLVVDAQHLAALVVVANDAEKKHSRAVLRVGNFAQQRVGVQRLRRQPCFDHASFSCFPPCSFSEAKIAPITRVPLRANQPALLPVARATVHMALPALAASRARVAMSGPETGSGSLSGAASGSASPSAWRDFDGMNSGGGPTPLDACSAPSRATRRFSAHP